MRPVLAWCALLLATAAGAAEQSQIPLEEPAFGADTMFEKPDVPGFGPEVEPLALGLVGVGGEQRVNGTAVVERPARELVDGVAAVGLRRIQPTHRTLTVGTLMLFAGTDPLADRDGRFLGGLSVAQGCWRTVLPIYDVRLDAGWSSEREAVLDADVVVGPLHLAAERDRFERAYHVGGVADAPPGAMPVRLGIDRIAGFHDGTRTLATQTWLELTVPIGDGLFLAGHGSYTRDAIAADGSTDPVWEGWLGMGVRW
jgi:hypothetical protein